MRSILIGAAALALAGSAAAQPAKGPAADVPRADPRSEAERDRELVRSIPDAREIEAMGETMDRVVGAVLDIPIGPLVDAIDAADPEGRRDRRRYGRNETIGDVAGRDDPYFEERVRDQIRGVAVGAGVMAEQIAVMAPEMRRAAERAADDIDRAMRDARERRERREREEDRRGRR